MNILMISRGFPTKKYPQWGCFEKDQAEALAKIGHNVVVVSVDSRFLFSFRKLGVTHICENGVNYYNSFWIPGAITNLFGVKFNQLVKEKQLDVLYKKVERKHGKPDIIFGQFFFNTFIGISLKNKYNIPLIGIEHAGRFNEDCLDKKTLFQSTIAYANSDAIISVSNSLKKRIKFHFDKSSYVVNNLVNQIFIKSVTNKKNSKLIFVSVASLVYGKGFDLLIEAFAKLNLSVDIWEMNIIGGGEELENLQKLINSVGLQNNIHLLGKKTKGEIVKYLSESDVFVLASRGETFGLVYAEAMMMGLPVIATICGGPEEFVRETDGLLVPVDDVDALADAIKYMFENYQSYDRAKIAEDCKNRFSPEVIARQLTDIFEKVVEEHKQKQLN